MRGLQIGLASAFRIFQYFATFGNNLMQQKASYTYLCQK